MKRLIMLKSNYILALNCDANSNLQGEAQMYWKRCVEIGTVLGSKESEKLVSKAKKHLDRLASTMTVNETKVETKMKTLRKVKTYNFEKVLKEDFIKEKKPKLFLLSPPTLSPPRPSSVKTTQRSVTAPTLTKQRSAIDLLGSKWSNRAIVPSIDISVELVAVPSSSLDSYPSPSPVLDDFTADPFFNTQKTLRNVKSLSALPHCNSPTRPKRGESTFGTLSRKASSIFNHLLIPTLQPLPPSATSVLSQALEIDLLAQTQSEAEKFVDLDDPFLETPTPSPRLAPRLIKSRSCHDSVSPLTFNVIPPTLKKQPSQDIRSKFNEMDPLLAALEANSRVNVESLCATCFKQGLNVRFFTL